MQPTVGRPAQLAIDVVDAETNAALPDGVTLFGGLRPFVDVTFYADRGGGVSVRRLDSARPGAYAASAGFFSPGPWRVLVSLGAPVSDTFAIGTLTVGKP